MTAGVSVGATVAVATTCFVPFPAAFVAVVGGGGAVLLPGASLARVVGGAGGAKGAGAVATGAGAGAAGAA